METPAFSRLFVELHKKCEKAQGANEKTKKRRNGRKAVEKACCYRRANGASASKNTALASLPF